MWPDNASKIGGARLMIINLRPKSLSRSVIASSSISSPQIPKWVSTLTAKIHPHQQFSQPLHHLGLFFNGFGKHQKQNQRQPDYELAVVSALKRCSSLRAICQMLQIHCLVLKSGLDSNIFVQNSLIDGYAKCGSISAARTMFDSCTVLDSVSCSIMLIGFFKSGALNDARQLFDKMPDRGCVSYTTMIMGFARNGYWIEAVEAFKDMRRSGVTPNEVTMASVFSAYSHLSELGDGRALHTVVTKLGLGESNLVATNLVHMYCLCSRLGDARIIFDEMLDPNVVSWNVMLNGYSKAGLIDIAKDLFERMPTKDIVSWGTMVDGYVLVGRLREALAACQVMLCTGLAPNEVMIVDLISMCGRGMAIDEGQQLHCISLKRGFGSYNFVQSTIIFFYAACEKIDLARLQLELGTKDHVPSWNAIISGCFRNRMIDRARQFFDEMPKRDVFSWSAMISGYAQLNQPDITLQLFHEMVASGIQPNEVTMVSVLSAIAASGCLKDAIWAHEYIRYNAIPFNDNLAAALIDMYSKCGSINRALELFNRIQDHVSSVSPWNAIIGGLAMHGHADLSLRIFSDLERTNIKLNSITFIGVLAACCHAGLVEAGKRYFESMKSMHNVERNTKHYGCMVDLLGRAGRVEEAEDLIKGMPMKADVVIWGTLLAACRNLGNVEIAERAAESLARLDTSHGPARVLLSNIYADAGRWEDAFSVRRAMRIQGLQRSSGSSGVV